MRAKLVLLTTLLVVCTLACGCGVNVTNEEADLARLGVTIPYQGAALIRHTDGYYYIVRTSGSATKVTDIEPTDD